MIIKAILKKHWLKILLSILLIVFIVKNQLKSNQIIKLKSKEKTEKIQFRDSIIKSRDLFIQKKIDSLDEIPKPKPQIIYKTPEYKDRTTQENLNILFR